MSAGSRALRPKVIRRLTHKSMPQHNHFNNPTTNTSLMTILHQLEEDSQVIAATIDTITYASLLRWSAYHKTLSHGKLIHNHIKASGRDGNTFLSNLLLQMYGKCGNVEDAWHVFHNMGGRRNVFSWNLMIAVYIENGYETQAIRLYKRMAMEGVAPDKFTFLPILSASATLQALEEGKQIHEHIVACGLEMEIAVSNALLHMYGKCGSLKDARTIFDKMHMRDVISWTAMIAAYTQNGDCNEALLLFKQMNLEGVKPDKITFLSALEACTNLGSLEDGQTIHQLIIARGLELDKKVTNALLNMYGKCGSQKNARLLFDKMRDRDVISWTTMIAACVLNGLAEEAIELFGQMDVDGIRPDKITFISMLEACGSLKCLEKGRAIHEHIIAAGFESDIAVSSALVDMYGKCGNPKDAHAVFSKIQKQKWNVILCTAMVLAYSQNGQYREALELFRQMELEGIKPDKVTFLSIIETCASLGSLESARAIHERVLASGLDSDMALKSALVCMYGKCGSLQDAQALFDEICEKDVSTWSAMIVACVQNGQEKEAIELFQQMELQGLKADKSTSLIIIETCASLGSLENGKAIHEHIDASGFGRDVAVRNALVSMYGKCGSLKDACKVFDEIDEWNVISLTAMIVANALNGEGREALKIFGQMDFESIKPDGIMFLSILNACSHEGLLDAGSKYFISMGEDYGIVPSEEHYICMCDLLGRAGCLNEAEDLISNMPPKPSIVGWTILLGACRSHGDVERGRCVAENIIEMHSEDASAYIMLSNIYSSAGRWEDVAYLRKAMEEME